MISNTSKRWHNKVIPIMSGLLFLAAPVYGLDFTVDTTADTTDSIPGDGICSDGAHCSLRAAIMEANATVGADTITLPAGIYLLELDGVDELCENTTIYPAGTACTGTGTVGDPYLPVITADASMGDLDITDDVTIIGAGPDVTTVQWGAAPLADTNPYTGDRIFHIQTDGASITSVTIQGLTMRNGETGLVPTGAAGVATPNAYDIDIVDATPGSVTIWQFRRMGGAIALGAGYAVVLYEETIHGPGGGGGGGGGGSDEGGPFPGGKPGEEEGFTIGEVVLNDVAVVGNWAGADGGGVFGGVTSQFSNAIIAGNTSGANGGGVYVAEPTTITDTTIGAITDVTLQRGIAGVDVGNTAENGGGMFDTGSHTTAITRSAINGNTAIGGGGIAGRSVVTINIANSTISGNTASDVGGGVTTNGTINLKNVTVVNNNADTDAPGGGGGLNAFGPGTYNMSNTLLAGNTKNAAAPVASNCGCSGGGACAPGVMVSNGWNLEDADTCNMNVLDLVNTDPMLLALANNGGVSETHNLASTSPAIDAGDINACAVLAVLLGNTDQRGTGFARSVDGNGDGTAECDIGALEFVPAPAPAPAPGGDNGGLCSYDPNAVFDPVLPGMLLLSIMYLLWNSRRLRTRQCRIDD